jgi:hypothetical protein
MIFKASVPTVNSPVGAVIANCTENDVFIVSLCQLNKIDIIVFRNIAKQNPKPVRNMLFTQLLENVPILRPFKFGLKILRSQEHAGSTPASGTT